MGDAYQFWKDEKLTSEEKNKYLVNTTRHVFNTDDGKIVLNLLLTDLFFYDQTQNEKEQALNEYAKFFIRERLGVGGTKTLTDFIAETAANRGGK